jgi:hypothetical protein
LFIQDSAVAVNNNLKALMSLLSLKQRLSSLRESGATLLEIDRLVEVFKTKSFNLKYFFLKLIFLGIRFANCKR